MSASPETALKSGRFEYITESTFGATPSDPEWNRISDAVVEWTGDIDVQREGTQVVGDENAIDHPTGAEDATLTVGYYLQNWFVDGSANPQDTSAYGIQRANDGTPLDSQTLMQRKEDYDNNGNLNHRLYYIARGARVASADVGIDPSQSQPILVEVTYEVSDYNSYRIDQPDSSTTLSVQSTASADTNIDVIVENEGAGTTETITTDGTDGTTQVTGATSFSDIDAIELSERPEGKITITDGTGTTFATLYGGSFYSEDGGNLDGDLGVPALGGGSHSSAIGSDYEHALGDAVAKPKGGSTFKVNADDTDLHVTNFSIENNVEKNPVVGSRHQVVDSGNQTITVDVDVSGVGVSHATLKEHLRGIEENIEWTPESGGSKSVDFENVELTDAGDAPADEPDQARAVVSNTFSAQGVTLNG